MTAWWNRQFPLCARAARFGVHASAPPADRLSACRPLLDQLEEMGVVGPSQGGGKEREVLVSDEDELDDEKNNSEHP
jgi:hypothetical protein